MVETANVEDSLENASQEDRGGGEHSGIEFKEAVDPGLESMPIPDLPLVQDDRA